MKRSRHLLLNLKSLSPMTDGLGNSHYLFCAKSLRTVSHLLVR